jgi:hypothetical protein
MDAAPSDAQPGGQRVAPGFAGRAPITPQDVQSWSRSQARQEPAAAAGIESAGASPSERSAARTEGGVLSAEDIAERVAKVLPDGSLPPAELAKARQLESERILERSKLAAALVQPPVQDPSPNVSSEPPAAALPQGTLPATAPHNMPTLSGTASGVAASR